MVHTHDVAAAIIVAVAVVSLALCILAARAWRASGSGKLGFVTAAFGVFVGKSLVTAYALRTNAIGHEDLELLGSLLDLAIVMLLIAPFLGARKP